MWNWDLATRWWRGICLGCGEASQEPKHFIGVRIDPSRGWSASHPGCIVADKYEIRPMVDLLESGHTGGVEWGTGIMPRLPWAQKKELCGDTPLYRADMFVTHEQLREQREMILNYVEKEIIQKLKNDNLLMKIVDARVSRALREGANSAMKQAMR